MGISWNKIAFCNLNLFKKKHMYMKISKDKGIESLFNLIENIEKPQLVTNPVSRLSKFGNV